MHFKYVTTAHSATTNTNVITFLEKKKKKIEFFFQSAYQITLWQALIRMGSPAKVGGMYKEKSFSLTIIFHDSSQP